MTYDGLQISNLMPAGTPGTYTPGYRFQNQDNKFEPYPLGTYSNPTPSITIPSIYEEDLDSTQFLSCQDFLGQGYPTIELLVEPLFEMLTRELLDNVHTQRFRASKTQKSGIESALEAIKTVMGFYHQTGRHLPLTIDQLRSLYRRRAEMVSPSTPVAPSDLAHLLRQCCLQSVEPFHLGVISPSQSLGEFNVYIHFAADPNTEHTIWLFQSRNQQDQWNAIIPPDFNPPNVSYAAAVLALPKNLPYRPSPTLNHTLLSSLPSKTSSSRGKRTAHSSGPTARRRSRSDSRQLGGRTAKPTSHRNHPPSECGSHYSCNNCQKSYDTKGELKHHQRKYVDTHKNHACSICQKRFQYPKDLKRHRQTHDHSESFACTACTRVYTRRDNLQRHVRDSHPGLVVLEQHPG